MGEQHLFLPILLWLATMISGISGVDNSTADLQFATNSGCDAAWIQSLNQTVAFPGERFESGQPMFSFGYGIVPATISADIDRCIITNWQAANLEDLTTKGYFRGSLESLEKTHYDQLAKDELLLPPLFDCKEHGCLTVNVDHIEVTDMLLDEDKGIATLDFSMTLRWMDKRLSPDRLKPLLNRLLAKMVNIDNRILIDNVWKPPFDLPLSYEFKDTIVRYTRLHLLPYNNAILFGERGEEKENVAATLSFAGYKADCEHETSIGDDMNCQMELRFMPVFSQRGLSLLKFNVSLIHPDDVKSIHAFLGIGRVHPPGWQVENIIVDKTLHYTSMELLPGLSVKIWLKEKRSLTTTSGAEPITTTSAASTVEFAASDDETASSLPTMEFEALDSQRAISSKESRAHDTAMQSRFFYAAGVTAAVAPFAGRANVKWAVATKLFAIWLISQPTPSPDVGLPGEFGFLFFFILISTVLDVLVFRVLEQLAEGERRVPPPHRLFLAASVLVGKFGWIFGIGYASPPAAPILPILAHQVGGVATNYASEWATIGSAIYMIWLIVASLIFFGVLVTYTI